MTHVLLLVVLAANQGYWLSGNTYPVTLQWNLEGQPEPAAMLTWEIKFGQVTTAAGKAALRDDKMPLKIDVPAPQVRVRTDMTLTYRVTSGDAKREVLADRIPLVIFPPNLLSGLAPRLKNKSIVVLDSRSELATLLTGAKLTIVRLDDPTRLDMTAADVVIVGADQVSDTPMLQSRFEGYAQSGATVVIFSQSRVRRLGGYDLIQRRPPVPSGGAGGAGGLVWRSDHPLLADVQSRDCESWLDGLRMTGAPTPVDPLAIQLPTDEPALEIAYWPREVPGQDPVPIDALLVVKALGKGRLVLCQLPLGPWATDPRSQIVLRNILDYTLSRPEPTLRPSQRSHDQPRLPRPERDVLTPSGAQP